MKEVNCVETMSKEKQSETASYYNFLRLRNQPQPIITLKL